MTGEFAIFVLQVGVHLLNGKRVYNIRSTWPSS